VKTRERFKNDRNSGERKYEWKDCKREPDKQKTRKTENLIKEVCVMRV
jgi:hypothetical protein